MFFQFVLKQSIMVLICLWNALIVCKNVTLLLSLFFLIIRFIGLNLDTFLLLIFM